MCAAPKDPPRDLPRLINLDSQWLNTHHRSGWPYAVESLRPLHSDQGILFDGFLEKKFAWGHEPGDRYNQFAPYRVPWVGVLHNPPEIPDWFNLNQHNPRDIFKTEEWKRSIVWCLGLFTLSGYLRDWLAERTSVPVENLIHPTETPELRFSMERFLANPDRKVVQVGWWLRRTSSLFQLRAEGVRKALLDIGHDYMGAIVRKELELSGDTSLADTVDVIPYLGPGEYDTLLSQNLIFLDLYDSSANNVIVECIVRSTPVLVNPLPAVREYLGAAYPLYFHTLEEAAEIVRDTDRISAGHDYLRRLPWKGELAGEAFRRAFAATDIYRGLERPAPKISIIASVFAADNDIRPFLEDMTRQSVIGLCELMLYDVPASHRDPAAVEATIREYAARHPNIVYERLSSDPGLYEIWNMQIRRARGRYIAMAPLDDRRSTECLEHLLLALEMNPQIDVVCAGVYATRTPGESWQRHTAYRTYSAGFNWQTADCSSLGSRFDFGLDDLFRRDGEGRWIDSDCLPHCMPVWRKSLHTRFGFFDERKYGPLADWEFWVRCAAGGTRFRLLRTVLGLYLENPESHNRRVPAEPIKRWIISEYAPRRRGTSPAVPGTTAAAGGLAPPAPRRARAGVEPSANGARAVRSDRFLLCALARTGSTTLMRALNCHPLVRCLHEPFNPDNAHANYRARVSDRQSLHAALDEIWKHYNGIKHVWHPTGWPFPEGSDFNRWLLTSGHPVLFLRRANALRRVVSSQISRQTGVYEGDVAQRERLLSFAFGPLDADWIRQQLAREAEWLAEARRCLEEAAVPHMELVYEELYEAGVGAEKRVRRVNRILDFLGRTPLEEESAARAAALLEPGAHQRNSQEIYGRIPGIEEVERLFGSDETGWLFR